MTRLKQISLSLFLWIPFLLLLPFGFAFLSLLAIYKWVVIILRRLLKQTDLIRQVSGLDVMFSTDAYFRRPYGSLGFVCFLDGPISYEVITKRLETALQLASPQGNSPVGGYEKLTSLYPTFWLGFPFWKRTGRKLRMEEHVKVMKPKESTTSPSKFNMHLDELNKLICGWMSEPFCEGRPLWEIRLVPQIAFFENASADLLHPRELDLDASFPSADIQDSSDKMHQVGSGSTVRNDNADDDGNAVIGTNNVEQEGKVGSILILKTHHMLGDGNSMLRLLDKIMDPPPGPSTKESIYCNGKGASPEEKVETKEQSQPPLEEKVAPNLQRQQNEQVIKIPEEKLPVTDQQEGEHADAHFNTKSSHFTATYIHRDGNAGEAIKVGNIPSQERKSFVGPPESKCYSWWWWWRWLKVRVGLSWRQLSNAIYFAFFIPSSIFSLVNDFVVHGDPWFTQTKESDRVNMATVGIPMARLNEIRRNLCKKRTLSQNTPPPGLNSQRDGYSDANEGYYERTPPEKIRQEEKHHLPVPIIVMAVAAFAAALQTLILKKSIKKFGSEAGEGVGNSGKSNRHVCEKCTKESKFSEVLVVNRDIPPSSSDSGGESFVNFVIALPLPKEHPGRFKFCNFWTHGILKVKMPERTPSTRLHQLNNFYWEMRNQQRPEIYNSLVKIYSLFPKPLLSLLSNYNMGASIGVTNMADWPGPAFIGGSHVYRKHAYFGLQWRHASLTLALLSYNGEMTATILANESVIPDQESVEKLLHHYFLEELERFGESCSCSGSNPVGV